MTDEERAWLEAFAVSIHKDLARVEKALTTELALLRTEVRSHRNRIADVEDVLSTWPAPAPCSDAE